MIAAIIILTFLAVFLLVSSVFLWITAAQESPSAVLKKRLRRMAMHGDEAIPEDLRSEIIREIPPFERLLSRLPLVRKLDMNLDHAGLKIAPTLFILCSLLTDIIGFSVVYLFTKKLLVALCVLVLLLLAPIALLRFLKRRREDKFTEQLPDVLAMISRSLRAGHSLNSAIELVGMEVVEPAGELFRIAYEQQKLGLRIIDTLGNMTQRIESLDLRFFITSVSINSDVGGNLSEVLDKLADTIRERLKIKRQVRVITAQGRLSGYILAALPIFVFIAFNILHPTYEEPLLKERDGNYMLIVALVLQVIGFLIIRKIVNIRI